MTPIPIEHSWSPEALFSKALIYVGEMERYTAGDWQLAFWAALSLEFVARAALAHISPTLLADRKNWRNIYHALGRPSTAKGYAPVSIPITEVLSILQEILTPTFSKELCDACITQCGKRNAELHSGENVFASIGTSAWLPEYYASCEILLQSAGRGLGDLFSDPGSASAMITSMKDKAAQSVQKEIETRRQLWLARTEDEQKILIVQALTWATRSRGHRVVCPACRSQALVHGSSQGAVRTRIGEELITQKQTMLPSSFECVACGLKITGLSKLSSCGLGDAFTSTSTISPADFFGLYTEDDIQQARAESVAHAPEWEDDHND
jgi:hypothetical protein